MPTDELLHPLLYPPALLLVLFFSLPLVARALGQSPAALWSALHNLSAIAALARTLAADPTRESGDRGTPRRLHPPLVV